MLLGHWDPIVDLVGDRRSPLGLGVQVTGDVSSLLAVHRLDGVRWQQFREQRIGHQDKGHLARRMAV